MLRKTKAKLESMYAREPQRGRGGLMYEIDATTRVSEEQGYFLASLHNHLRPAISIEIGFAYGFSALHILDSMFENGYGNHIAVDPFETDWWKDIGLTAVDELGFSSRFKHISAHSVHALTDLKASGAIADYIYIDGNHTFDAALLDFCCADKLLSIGGVMILDDMWMPAIQKVALFIRRNFSSYEEMPSPVANIFCLKKIEEDKREWNHFVDF